MSAQAPESEARIELRMQLAVISPGSHWLLTLPSSGRLLRIFGYTLIELLLTLVILGIVTSIAVAGSNALREKTDRTLAAADLRQLEGLLERYFIVFNRYPSSLDEIPAAAGMRDPWGNPYQYLNIATTKGKGKVRKDHNLVPLNTDYDLYSMGKDGKSQSPLTAAASRDDIVRANNGAFIGLAIDY